MSAVSTNLWRRLKQLLPDAPLLIGTVIAVSDYDVFVQLPDGAQLRARGEASVGQVVFVRDGLVEGEAPNLTLELIEE